MLRVLSQLLITRNPPFFMEARLITRFVEVAKLHPATSVYVGTRLGIYLLYVYIETHVCKLM